jgi:hypothetical protein
MRRKKTNKQKGGIMKHFHLISIILAVGIFIVMGFGLTVQQEDSICDPSESIDCADCQFPPLDMSQKQIVMYNHLGRIYQFKYADGIYYNTWVSETLPISGTGGISVGDADNDGMPDITAVVKNDGRGKKFAKIYMYKHGSQGAPDYVSSDFGRSFSNIHDSIIADADDDGQNELIIADEDNIKIFRWDGSDFINIWNSPSYPSKIYSVDVGDADNDGLNEIVLAAFFTDSAVILESLGNDVWGNEQMTEPIPEEYYRPGFEWLAIDYAKVRNADNIPGNEIVAGGNNNRLMIWKHNKENGEYDIVFISEDLGGFTQGADAGDIDGDGFNEVITLDADYTNDILHNVYRFDYDAVEETYDQSTIYSHNHYLNYLALGSIDDDSIDEIVLFSDTLVILGNGGNFSAWEFPYCGPFEIWKETTNVEPDLTPPAAVFDLWADNSTSSSIDLTWTAPGDDDSQGTASHYDIRYSTSEIYDSNWDEANQCSGEPSPSAAGSLESFTVTGLSPSTFYCFALKTADEASNWSSLSNIASGSTQEATTQSMHISAIDMSLKTAGPNVNALAMVTIVDAFGNPVSGAIISGYWSGATSEVASGVTDENGQVEFASSKLRNIPSGTTFTFTVDSVEKDGWTYDPSSNVETTDSIIY